MIRGDYHTHSIFDDGKSTLIDMAEAAEKLGLLYFGFSGHSYQSFDQSFCIQEADVRKYLHTAREIRRHFQEKGSRMELLVGLELDLFGKAEKNIDYIIGSVHYLKEGGEYFCIDESPEKLSRIVETHYGGDWYRMTDAYYALMERIPEETGCDIVGHFDLVTKFNEGNRLFDETSPRYLGRAYEVMESLVKKGLVFEINTGAIARGWRSLPYPGMPLLRHLRALGGEIVINSDAHEKGTVAGSFDLARDCALAAGFTHTNLMTECGWRKVPLSDF